MKWLTLDEIKDQLRIEHDFDLEDTKLTLYGESAEQAILDLCRRTYDDFIDNYGAIPPARLQAPSRCIMWVTPST